MDVESVLTQMEELLARASRVPLTSRVVVDEAGFYELIQALRKAMPGNLGEASRILRERESIVESARREAQSMVEQAQVYAARLVSESQVVRDASARAERMLAEARDRALEIHEGARQYADRVLEDLERELGRVTDNVKRNREELLGRAMRAAASHSGASGRTG